MDENSKSNELKSTGYELFILLLSLVSIFNLGIDVLGSYLGIIEPIREVIVIINRLLTNVLGTKFLAQVLSLGVGGLTACVVCYLACMLLGVTEARDYLKRLFTRRLTGSHLDN